MIDNVVFWNRMKAAVAALEHSFKEQGVTDLESVRVDFRVETVPMPAPWLEGGDKLERRTLKIKAEFTGTELRDALA